MQHATGGQRLSSLSNLLFTERAAAPASTP
jgi:hypothetical protein